MATTSRERGLGRSAGVLSLRDAAVLFAVPLRTLRTKVSRGEIPGYRVRGLRGREWRVTEEALEDAGLRRRSGAPDATVGAEPVAAGGRELAEAWRTAWAERDRAVAVDQELGYALLECGRLLAVNAELERRLAVRESVEHSDA